MRAIITGVKDGKACVIEEIDCTPPEGDGVRQIRFQELSFANLPPRPPGRGKFLDLGLPPGVGRWTRVFFPPNSSGMHHHTDTLDYHTVVSGSIELTLDDGPHQLLPGDTLVVAGVDHSWLSGPEGCILSTMVFGTPAP
jgi:quercetin dioxygenase-like cupin family protein